MNHNWKLPWVKMKPKLMLLSTVAILLIQQKLSNNWESQFQDIVVSTEEFKLIMYSVWPTPRPEEWLENLYWASKMSPSWSWWRKSLSLIKRSRWSKSGSTPGSSFCIRSSPRSKSKLRVRWSSMISCNRYSQTTLRRCRWNTPDLAKRFQCLWEMSTRMQSLFRWLKSTQPSRWRTPRPKTSRFWRNQWLRK